MNTPDRPDDGFGEATASLFDMSTEEFHNPSDPVTIPTDPYEPPPLTQGAWQIRTRSTGYSEIVPPFSVRGFPEHHHAIGLDDIYDVEAMVRDPHAGIRRICAVHPELRPQYQAALTRDDYREVRASLLCNPSLAPDVLDTLLGDPAKAVRTIAQRRVEGIEGTNLLGPYQYCVECAAPIKTIEFRTCSVKCSLAQHKRRIKRGFWVDAIHADFRYSNGLRYDWPWSFQWDVATSYKGGSAIPGIGPVKRDMLISFVRHLPAKDIVKFASRVRASGLDQRAALNTLAAIGYSHAGTEALHLAEEHAGLIAA